MKKKYPAFFLLLVSLLLIGIGIWQGQPSQVLAKAIRVCMECVGIG